MKITTNFRERMLVLQPENEAEHLYLFSLDAKLKDGNADHKLYSQWDQVYSLQVPLSISED